MRERVLLSFALFCCTLWHLGEGLAASNGTQEILVLPNGTYTGPFFSFHAENVTIRSESGNPGDVIIDCQYNPNAIVIDNGVAGNQFTLSSGGPISISIVGLSFTNCVADPAGGAILINGSLSQTPMLVHIVNCSFYDNEADLGAAIYIETSPISVIVTDSVFTNNLAQYGGAIFAQDYATLTIERCSFSNNTALQYGGGVFVVGHSVLRIVGSQFLSNVAKYTGGGLYVGYNSRLTLNESYFVHNAALYAGGAAGVETSQALINSCTFNGNIAPSGGGIFGISINVLIYVYNSLLTQNIGTNYGGAVCVSTNARIYLENSLITENAGYDGGAVASFTNAHVVVIASNVTNNYGVFGGAFYLDDQSELYATNAALRDNIGDESADSIYCRHSLIQLNHTVLTSVNNRNAEPMGVVCAAVPRYTWCTLKIIDSGNFSDTCIAPDQPPAASSDGLETWQVALICVAAVVAMIALGFAVAVGLARLFNKSTDFRLLPVFTSKDETEV